jgi:hypothetical protein
MLIVLGEVVRLVEHHEVDAVQAAPEIPKPKLGLLFQIALIGPNSRGGTDRPASTGMSTTVGPRSSGMEEEAHRSGLC